MTTTVALREETANTQFAKTLDYDISSSIVLDRNGRQIITLTADTELNVSSITNLEGGFCELQFLASPYVLTLSSGVLSDRFTGDTFEINKRNDLLIVWNDPVDASDTSIGTRLRSIQNTVLDAY